MDWDCVRRQMSKTLENQTINIYGPKIFKHLKFHTPHFNPLHLYEIKSAAELTSLTMAAEIKIGENEMKKMEEALYKILETCMKK